MFSLLGCAPTGGGGGSAAGDQPANENEAPANDNEAQPNGNEAEANENAAEPVEGGELVRFTTADFAGSGTCTACHNRLSDEGGNDVSIPDAWRSTVLANAAADPFFLASVEAEAEHAPPSLREVVEDTCAACHMPMARTQAAVDGSPTLMLGDGFLDPANALHEAAIDAVSCTLCHQIGDEQLGEPDGFNGGYVINTETVEPDRLLYGPYPDPEQPALMQGSVGYLPVEGPHLSESALCATCHTLFTPTLDASGEIVGQFPEQVAFLEWQHSRFGDGAGDDDRSCQACHMPLADGAVAISSVPPGLAARAMFRQHTFLAGNVYLLRLLRDNVAALELTASTAAFDEAVAGAESLLQNETADISIEEAGISSGVLTVAVAIDSRVGHKFPTGFPSRRAWLHFTVTDADGGTVFESGAAEADGRITGNDADADASLAEPHYQTIDSEDQVQIYESVMEDTEGEVTYELLRAAAYRKDNRLLPEGFDPATAGADFAVAGAAMQDGDFVGGSDGVSYEVQLDQATGPFAVTVELLFQSVSYRFAESVIELGLPLTDAYGELHEAADKSPTLVASAEMTVED
jgi:hypothetical protein